MISGRTREHYPILVKLLEERRDSGRWLILTHDNPDPDSIAAAAALGTLLKHHGQRVTAAYGGIIGRAENREMVRTLGIRLSHVRHLRWDRYPSLALVDTQPRTGNNQLAADRRPDLVFDHHPLRQATRSTRLADVRADYGATATILCEYLEAAGIEISRTLATALVYAVRTETQDFSREFSRADRRVYRQLQPQIDERAMARIRSPRLTAGYFRNLHDALENVETVSTLVVSHLGGVEQPDIVSEVADLLLRLEGMTWSLCTGVYEGRVYLSIRTTNSRADAGRLMRRLVGRRGKGGGHGMMAGGWVTVGSEDPRRTQSVLGDRLARALKKRPDRFERLS